MRRLALIIFAAGALAAIAAGPAAAAVDLPAKQSRFTSPQLLDGKFLWFQRNDRSKPTKKDPYNYTPGVGAIYARDLTAKEAQRVYLPPKGSKIVSFKAAAGRVVVGLAPTTKDGRGPSSIVELTPGATTPWPASPLEVADDKIDQQVCGSRVELITVQSDGDALIQKSSLEARGKDCVLTRQVAEVSSLPRSGPPVVLGTRKSGWNMEKRANLLPTLFPANGDWLPVFVGVWDGMYSTASTWNPSGDSRKLFDDDTLLYRSEPTAEGGILTRGWGSDYVFYPNLGDPNTTIPLKRDGATSWFHVCGTSFIEITRKRSAGFSGKWNIMIRNSAGQTERKLTAKLNAGTLFDTCDQNTAVFHRWRHDGGVRQWSVSLAP
ncbi:MAG: hypothetical protein ACRDKE_12555 [Solirubrobacterales bacterium]